MNRTEAEAFLPRIMEIATVSPKRLQTGPISDSARLMKLGVSAVGFELSLAQFCLAMLQLGPQCIIITDGKHGAYAATANELTYCPSLASQVVGTAGAGDAFTSTFTAHYANGCCAGEALQRATVNATSVIAFADTLTGLLTKSQIEDAWQKSKHSLPLNVWKFG